MTDFRLLTSNLIGTISKLTRTADTVYWITAFAMQSGVRLVLPHLQEAIARGAEVKILVGDYLFITQPEALELLVEHVPQAEIYLYESRGTSFHPKAYLFRSDAQSHVIVGSSNLSASALTKGVEWSIHAPFTFDKVLFETAVAEFMKLFLSSITVKVNKRDDCAV